MAAFAGPKAGSIPRTGTPWWVHPQEIAVIAGWLNDEALGPKTPLRHDLLYVVSSVLQEGWRNRREIRIVSSKEEVRGYGC